MRLAKHARLDALTQGNAAYCSIARLRETELKITDRIVPLMCPVPSSTNAEA